MAFVAAPYSGSGSDGPPLGLARQPEPSALILNDPACCHFRVLDPRFRSRSDTDGGGSALVLSRHNRLPQKAQYRLWLGFVVEKQN